MLTNETVEASYWTLNAGLPVARTVEVSADVHADVDSAGRIIGVERICGVVDMAPWLRCCGR